MVAMAEDLPAPLEGLAGGTLRKLPLPRCQFERPDWVDCSHSKWTTKFLNLHTAETTTMTSVAVECADGVGHLELNEHGHPQRCKTACFWSFWVMFEA